MYGFAFGAWGFDLELRVKGLGFLSKGLMV